MALSRSIVQPFRQNMLLIGAGWRGYFGPWDYQAALTSTTGGPKILDLEVQGPFSTTSPPTGFTDTGWIKEFRVTPQSKIGQVRSGYRGAVRAQYRGEVGLQFEFKFRESGRLQMKLASGTTVLNMLAPANGATAHETSPLGTAGAPAVSMTSYSVVGASAILSVSSASGFVAGNYIVCDTDYSISSGVIGSNGSWVFPNAVTDVDYIRKTSDFVARILSINGNNLTLDQPFVGGGAPAATNGTPLAGSKVQKVLGWTAREGGTFIQEWSGIFLSDTIDGAQIAMYFPHISPMQFRTFPNWAIENVGNTDLSGYEIDAAFNTLAFDDPIDGETVVGYYAYYPNARVQNTY